jgi:hypothetical protein
MHCQYSALCWHVYVQARSDTATMQHEDLSSSWYCAQRGGCHKIHKNCRCVTVPNSDPARYILCCEQSLLVLALSYLCSLDRGQENSSIPETHYGLYTLYLAVSIHYG